MKFLPRTLQEWHLRYGSDAVHLGLFGRLVLTGFFLWVVLFNGIFGLLLGAVLVPALGLIVNSVWGSSHQWRRREAKRREITRNFVSALEGDEAASKQTITARRSVPRRW